MTLLDTKWTLAAAAATYTCIKLYQHSSTLREAVEQAMPASSSEQAKTRLDTVLSYAEYAAIGLAAVAAADALLHSEVTTTAHINTDLGGLNPVKAVNVEIKQPMYTLFPLARKALGKALQDYFDNITVNTSSSAGTMTVSQPALLFSQTIPLPPFSQVIEAGLDGTQELIDRAIKIVKDAPTLDDAAQEMTRRVLQETAYCVSASVDVAGLGNVPIASTSLLPARTMANEVAQHIMEQQLGAAIKALDAVAEQCTQEAMLFSEVAFQKSLPFIMQTTPLAGMLAMARSHAAATTERAKGHWRSATMKVRAVTGLTSRPDNGSEAISDTRSTPHP